MNGSMPLQDTPRARREDGHREAPPDAGSAADLILDFHPPARGEGSVGCLPGRPGRALGRSPDGKVTGTEGRVRGFMQVLQEYPMCISCGTGRRSLRTFPTVYSLTVPAAPLVHQ